MSDGHGYGPREATLLDAEKAHMALEAIPTNDPRWQAAWDQAFATSRNYFRSVQRDREQRQGGAGETVQAGLFGGAGPGRADLEAGR